MGFQFVSSGNAWLRCCCFLHPLSWLPFVFLQFTAVFQLSFLNILALRTCLRIEKWYFRNHAIITRKWPPIVKDWLDFWFTDAYMLAQDGPGCFDAWYRALRTASFGKNHHFKIFFVPVEIRFNIHLALCSQTRSSTTNLNMVKIAFWSSLSQNRDSNSFLLLMDVILACRPSVLEQQKKTAPHVLFCVGKELRGR